MNLQTIDLNLLVAFEALMEERNVTRAAKRLGLSQPAMSNALARLRRTLGDPLLVKMPGGMSPTPAAQALIGPIRASLAHLRAALEDKPAFDPASSNRTFHLLANDYAETALLGHLIRAIRVVSRDVGLRVHRPQNIFQAPSAAALSASLDFAVGFFPDLLSLEHGIQSTVLWEEENACIASASHPSIRGKLSIRQYASAHHAAVFYKPEGPGVIDNILEQKGLARRSVLYVPHFNSVPFVVASTDLIATVPARLAERFRKHLKLQVLPLPFAMPPFRLTLVWHERFQSDAAHEWLRSLIRKVSDTV